MVDTCGLLGKGVKTMKEMIAEYEEENQAKVVQDEPACPACDVVLDEDDCFDHIYGGSYMERLCVGHCPRCEENYQWREVSFFGGHSHLEKSED